MNRVVIRDVEARDIPAIKAVIREIWDWEGLIDDEQTLDATIGIYFNQILYAGTFGRVAVLNGKVAGVIFGSVDGAVPKYRMLMEDGTAHAVTLLGASKANRENTYEYLAKITVAYKQLVGDIADDYDGTLDFLILAKETQGLGIGKSLWMALKSYFEENNAKSIYLYSDTECNYGFYEHQGFTRKNEQEVTFAFGRESFNTNIFLYDIQFNQ